MKYSKINYGEHLIWNCIHKNFELQLEIVSSPLSFCRSYWISPQSGNMLSSTTTRDEICTRTGSVRGKPPYYPFRNFIYNTNWAEDGEESKPKSMEKWAGCFFAFLCSFLTYQTHRIAFGHRNPANVIGASENIFFLIFLLHFLVVTTLDDSLSHC